MCETNAYIENESGEELYLENVETIRPAEGTVYLKNIFGEQRTFEGALKEISLKNHKVILKKE